MMKLDHPRNSCLLVAFQELGETDKTVGGDLKCASALRWLCFVSEKSLNGQRNRNSDSQILGSSFPCLRLLPSMEDRGIVLWVVAVGN